MHWQKLAVQILNIRSNQKEIQYLEASPRMKYLVKETKCASIKDEYKDYEERQLSLYSNKTYFKGSVIIKEVNKHHDPMPTDWTLW